MTTTLKLFSCLVFMIFLAGCGGGGGGGGASPDGFRSLSTPVVDLEAPAIDLSLDVLADNSPADNSGVITDSDHRVSNPEPATMLLFGMGLSGLAFLRRKRA